ncbi:MAG: hypothetical protein ACRD2B_03085 [Terriglobia bacterium]
MLCSPRVKTPQVATLRLTSTARWGEHVLKPGDYTLHLCAHQVAPIVAIHGVGVAAMLMPTHVSLCDRGRLSTLFLTPCAPPPRVRLLRLASAGVDLYFLEDAPSDTAQGLLALPLSSHAGFSGR